MSPRILLLALLLGCGAPPPSAPEPTPAPPPEPTPAPAGWTPYAVTRLSGLPRAMAFDPVGPDLVVLDAWGRTAFVLGPDGAEQKLLIDPPAKQLLVRQIDGRRTLVLLREDGRVQLWRPGEPARDAGTAQLLAAMPGDPAAWEAQDGTGRAEGAPEAFRGQPVPGGSRVRATRAKTAPLIVEARPDGSLRRIGLTRIPDARSIQLLGADAFRRVWLRAGAEEPGPDVEPPKHLVFVDLDGRILTRAVLPFVRPPTDAGPGAGKGRVFAVHPDGRLAVGTPGADGLDLRIYRLPDGI